MRLFLAVLTSQLFTSRLKLGPNLSSNTQWLQFVDYQSPEMSDGTIIFDNVFFDINIEQMEKILSNPSNILNNFR